MLPYDLTQHNITEHNLFRNLVQRKSFEIQHIVYPVVNLF